MPVRGYLDRRVSFALSYLCLVSSLSQTSSCLHLHDQLSLHFSTDVFNLCLPLHLLSQISLIIHIPLSSVVSNIKLEINNPTKTMLEHQNSQQ